MENTAMAVSGIIGLALIVLGIILTIFWIFLPFLLLSKLGKILTELQRLNQEQTVRHYESLKATNAITNNTAIMAQAASPHTPVA